MVWKIFLTAVVGYLIGSVSFAVILSRLVAKKDVRDYGSGNAGATNVARVFGMLPGIGILIADGLKMAAAMYCGKLIGGETGYLIAAAACLVGHSYPVFFGFRGGKGVSVSAALGLILDVRLFLLLFVVFFAVFFFTRRVSVCSMACAVSYPFLALLVGFRGGVIWLSVFVMISVVFLHRENIKRLIAGTEAPFSPKKKQ